MLIDRNGGHPPKKNFRHEPIWSRNNIWTQAYLHDFAYVLHFQGFQTNVILVCSNVSHFAWNEAKEVWSNFLCFIPCKMWNIWAYQNHIGFCIYIYIDQTSILSTKIGKWVFGDLGLGLIFQKIIQFRWGFCVFDNCLVFLPWRR